MNMKLAAIDGQFTVQDNTFQNISTKTVLKYINGMRNIQPNIFCNKLKLQQITYYLFTLKSF